MKTADAIAETRRELEELAAAAEAFGASTAALRAYVDNLPESEAREAAKKHLAAFAFYVGMAAGLDLQHKMH